MRVTNAMLSNKMLTNINRNLGLLDKYNTQGSTGKKIRVPSDDPIIASRSLKFRTMVAETEQYKKNAADSTSWMDATEAVFVNINKILIDMEGLMTSGSNDSYTLEDRVKMLKEYNSLIEQLEQELNSDYMGRNLFSGFRTDIKPIIQDENGKNVLNPEIYGDTVPDVEGHPTAQDSIGEPPQNIAVQVGAGITVNINSLVTDIYNQADYDMLRGGLIGAGEQPTLPANVGEDNPDGQGAYFPNNNGNRGAGNYFDNVIEFVGSQRYQNMTKEQKLKFEQDIDLRGNMAGMINKIKDFQSKIAVNDTDVGVRSKRVDLVESRLKDDEVNYKEVMSKNEDADLAEVMMNYNTASAAYTASLNIGMKITQMTLADYLR